MDSLVSRTGRQNQRYNDENGRRLIVGCIPYRCNKIDKPCDDDVDQGLEVLVISSRTGHGILFPKGGWENDESMEEAASREAMEEAGVRGKIEENLGTWNFKSKRQDIVHEGSMFPLQVEEQLDAWPEKHFRQRRWVSVLEVKDKCQYWWMNEALDKFVSRLSRSNSHDLIVNYSQQLEDDCAPISLTH